MANRVSITVEVDGVARAIADIVALREAIKSLKDAGGSSSIAGGDANRTGSFIPAANLASVAEEAGKATSEVERLGQAIDGNGDGRSGIATGLHRAASYAHDLSFGLEKVGNGLDKYNSRVQRFFNRGGIFGSAIGSLLTLPTELAVGALKVGNVIEDAVNKFASIGQGGPLGSVITQFSQLAPILAPLIGLIGGTTAAIVALTVVLGGAVLVWDTLIAVLNTAADVLGTLVAVAAAAAGPLGVLFAVVGGLGVGAFLGFQRALKSAGPWAAGFRKEIENLKGGFSNLTKELAVDFMPWFTSLGKVANNVLGYFEHLAIVAGKGGLPAVFKSLTAGGFARLNKDFLSVIGPIGDVISQVISFAFGRGGHEGETILAGDFHRFISFVQRAGSPIAAWFGRQHFGKIGADLAHDVIDSSAVRSAIGRVARFLFTTFKAELERALGPQRYHELVTTLHTIVSDFRTIASLISTLNPGIDTFKLAMTAIKVAAEAVKLGFQEFALPLQAAISLAQTLASIINGISLSGPGGATGTRVTSRGGHGRGGLPTAGGSAPPGGGGASHGPRGGHGGITNIVHLHMNGPLSSRTAEKYSAQRVTSHILYELNRQGVG